MFWATSKPTPFTYCQCRPIGRLPEFTAGLERLVANSQQAPAIGGYDGINYLFWPDTEAPPFTQSFQCQCRPIGRTPELTAVLEEMISRHLARPT